MKKKVLALVLVLVLVVSLSVAFTACDRNNGDDEFKIGLICLHDENSTYDKNFIDAMNAVKAELGLKDSQVLMKTGINEDNTCYEAAADLVDQGCDVIFADSFGHEEFIIKAAKEFTNVQFCHATGTRAHTEGLANYHNAFAAIYEGRYLAGVAAGLKLNEMITAGKFEAKDAKIGYVGAFTYAEVISGFTSFYLGAKSVCPTVTMEVKYTGSWYDEKEEKNAANALIGRGAKLISQHADSMGAPTACETANIPNITYNLSTKEACPKTYLIGSKINWAPYFKYIIAQTQNGQAIDKDWVGTTKMGSVQILEINDAVAAKNTKTELDKVAAKLADGSLNIFDTNNFTVGGKQIDSYLADVDYDNAHDKDTEVIENGIFKESNKRSAPYFDIIIDGITTVDGVKY